MISGGGSREVVRQNLLGEKARVLDLRRQGRLTNASDRWAASMMNVSRLW